MLTVDDVMTKNPITISPETSVSDAATVMRTNRIGAVPVTKNGKVVGIITETDLLRLLNVDEITDDLWLPSPLEVIELPIREAINWEKTKNALTNISETLVTDIMVTDVLVARPDDEIEAAAAKMLKKKIARLPVVGENDLIVGIVTKSDLIWGMSRQHGAAKGSDTE